MVHPNHSTHNPERKMKNPEFHKPFIQSLVFVAIVTIVSMVFSHIYIRKHLSSTIKPHDFTSAPSEFSTKQ